jgi:GTP-binding protein
MIRKVSAGLDTGKQGKAPPAESGERERPVRVDLPLVAVVGRPNVGKSTLFNRLVGERKAIVRDTPGVTRDRIMGEVEWGAWRFRLVDTGGLELDASPDQITGKIRSQIQQAFRMADLLLFVVDGRHPPHPQDPEIVQTLRKTRKPVVCAVNKIDAPSHQDNLYPFYRLGLDPLFPVSAEHGIGFSDLLDHITECLPGPEAGSLEQEEEDAAPPIRLAVVGRPNVGKSTLVNRLLQEERQLVDPMPGTTRDVVDSPFQWRGRSFLLMDTAGIRRKGKVKAVVEKFAVVKALQCLDRCDVALLLVDAVEGVTDQDAHIGGYILEKGKSLIILVNKWDLVKSTVRNPEELLKRVRHGLPHLQFVPLLPVSAMTGAHLDKAMAEACRVHEFSRMQVPTGPLNRLLQEAVEGHPPPSDGSRIRRLNYITQVKTAPPMFVIFSNSSRKVHFSYERYLIGQIRRRFGFQGVPIRLVFRKKR